MPIVRIDAREISDFETFHTVFARTFGFPDFYGRNMNAWIDCMKDLADPGACMTKIHGSPSDPVVLRMDNIDALPQELYEALVNSAAFVNLRRLELGDPGVLMLAFHRRP